MAGFVMHATWLELTIAIIFTGALLVWGVCVLIADFFADDLEDL